MSRKLATQHYQEGDLERALAAYEAALKEEPRAADLWHALALIKAQQGDYERALVDINHALKYEPKNVMIHNNRGNICAYLKDWKEAEKSYHHALLLEPHYPAPYNGLGKCYYQHQDFTKADDYFSKAIALKSDYTEAHYNRALLLIQKKQIAAAIAELESVILIAPDFTAALGQLGELYLETSDYEKALRVLDRRAAIEPHHIEANHSLAQALALTDHLEDAITYYEKTLQLNSNHLEAHHNLANSYLTLGDAEKALTYFLRQLEIKPLPETYYNIGVILLSKERNQEAIYYLEEAKKWQPDYLPIYLNLGGIYLKQQNYQHAITTYQKALEIDPGNQELHYIVKALSQSDTPDRAPNEYLQNLFNQYAHYYDAHLENYLGYNVPKQLSQLWHDTTHDNHPIHHVVDLGCGTGLSGEAFKKLADVLIGIDLSEQMIAVARQKNIYTDLIIGDIEKELVHLSNIDLILAADVFSYFGNLSMLFKASFEALNNEGYLLFSIEKATQNAPYHLHNNMRYTHTKQYIESLAAQHHFTIAAYQNSVLRQQQKEPVEGYLFLLKKSDTA